MIPIETDNTPVYETNSLTEYIKRIKTHHLEEYISRGEDQRYPSINAAAFRRNSSLDIRKMTDEFQSYIGNSLTEMQNKHFLAFCQHYGLPTNLLDFTHSPLISLYFACASNPEENGYVYFIKNDRLISLNDHLDLINTVFFPMFLVPSEELADLFDGITKVFALREEYVVQFLKQIDRMIGGYPGNESIHSEIQRILQSKEDYCIDHLDCLLTLMDKRAKAVKGMNSGRTLENLGSYGHLFVQLLVLLVFVIRRDLPFDLPFYFTYEPANITNRVSNQSSVFLYQLYGIDAIRQAIHPDCILQIGNKAEILADLDYLGINEKFIFNDYDHIASYIKKKHLVLSDQREKTLQNLKQMAQSYQNGKL